MPELDPGSPAASRASVCSRQQLIEQSIADQFQLLAKMPLRTLNAI